MPKLSCAFVVSAIALAWPHAGLAEAPAPRFLLPVDCAVPETCFIQQYVDTQAGEGAKDYRCGPHSYNGHGGTDFRVRTMAEMEAGVTVVAAAPGVVKAIRDGMKDINVSEIGKASVAGRNAGNVVIIAHGQGWESAYAHLKQGSVQVKRGQRVEAGTPLGEIGLSGKTEFPHVHFGVRHNGVELDPFTGRAEGDGCGAGDSLWDPSVAEALVYVPGGALFDGFLDQPPEVSEAIDGAYDGKVPERTAPALVYYGLAWGLHKGDRELIELIGPNGRPIARSAGVIERDKARWMRFAGRRRPEGGWPSGTYVGRYLVRRGDETIVEMSRSLVLE